MQSTATGKHHFSPAVLQVSHTLGLLRMAMMMARRAVLVFIYTATSAYGGSLFLPSGHAVDYRFLVFGVLVIYVAIQAHAKPFILPSDNALEQCILIALMLIIFLDQTLAVPMLNTSSESGSISEKLEVRTVAVLIITVLILVLVLAHKGSNAKAAKLAKIGIVSTKKVLKLTEDDTDDPDANDDEKADKATKKADKERIETENAEIGRKYDLIEGLVKEYRDAFAIFDDDASGQLDANELSRLFYMMDQPIDNVEELMNELDDDNSGTVRNVFCIESLKLYPVLNLCPRCHYLS